MSKRAFAPLLALFVTGCGFRLGYDLHERCSPGARDCTTDPSDVTGDGDEGDGIAFDDGEPAEGDGRATDDGANADGEGDGDGGEQPAAGCGSLHLLRETFDGPVSGARFFHLGQGNAGPDDGHLWIAPAAGEQITYNAQSAYDFHDAVMEVRVLRTAAAVQGIALKDGKSFDRFSQPIVPDEDGVAFQIANGELLAVETSGTRESVLQRAPHDAVAQAYLRLREADGSVWFETSADRVSWTTFHRAAVAMDPTLVFASLFARSGPDAGAEAWFDDLNTRDVEVLGFCPVAELEDSLDDDALGRDLKPWNGAGSCTVEEWQGNVNLTFGGEYAVCALVATPRFDLTDDLLYVEFESLFADGMRSTMVELVGESGARLQFTVAGGQLVMNVSDGSAVSFESTVAADLSRLRFLVLGESAGQLYFAMSENGGSLETLAETPTMIDVTALTVNVWGFDSGSGEAAIMRIASLNLP